MPAGYLPLTWSPQKQRQLLHQLVVEALLVTLERGSALLLEDIHWADPSTLELLDLLLTKTCSRSAMIVLTARPDRSFTWVTPPETVHLGGLDEPSVRTLAAALIPDAARADFDFNQVLTRSDGVPLYVEEIAIALGSQLHAAARKEGPATEVVPSSLRDLLTSRLEEIGEGREAAQFAAAIGREFPLELLVSLHDKDEFSLVSDLEELVSAQILEKRLRLDGTVYLFRHALIREAAYDSMPRERRQRVHASIAEGLERKFPRLAETEPDVLAHHHDRAGAVERAIHFWQLAAQRSSFASAHLEAIAQIDRALELMRGASTSGTEVEEAQLLLTRGAIIVAKRGYTDPDAKACFERIVALVPAQGDTLQLAFAARWGLWYFNNTTANLRESCALADDLRSLALDSPNSTLRLSGWAATCQSRFCTGRLEEAVAASRECALVYDYAQHQRLALKFGDDPRVSSGSFEALAEMIRGNHALASQRVDECLDLAERLKLPSLRAGMHGQAAWVFLNWGSTGAATPNLERARYHADEAVKISREHGFPFWELYGKLNAAAIRIASGDVAALAELRAGSDIWRRAGAQLGRCWHLTFIAQGLQRSGSFAEAGQVFEEALAFCEAQDARYFESEVRRQRAHLLADELNPTRNLPLAISECARAASDAKRIGARWWQLASLVTGLRLEPSPEVARDLAELLRQFPDSREEPPLLSEARRLAS
jgi:hypothetical protein